MSVLVYLIPIALFLGLVGLGAFLWSLKSGQYDDLEGAAERILFDDDVDGDDDGGSDSDGGGAPASDKAVRGTDGKDSRDDDQR